MTRRTTNLLKAAIERVEMEMGGSLLPDDVREEEVERVMGLFELVDHIYDYARRDINDLTFKLKNAKKVYMAFHIPRYMDKVDKFKVIQKMMALWTKEPFKAFYHMWLPISVAEQVLLKIKVGNVMMSNIGIFGEKGRTGIGKTTYAVVGYYLALLFLGIPKKVAREIVYRSIIWDLAVLKPVFDEASKKNIQVPVLILDDIGVHASKYWIFENLRLQKLRLMNLFRKLEIGREICTHFVFTAPQSESTAKAIREFIYAEYIGSIMSISPNGYITKFILKMPHVMPWIDQRTGTVKVKETEKVFIELLPFTNRTKTNLRIPDDLYQRMMYIRDVIRKRLDEMEEMIEEKMRELEVEVA